jgi:hypothetical protein
MNAPVDWRTLGGVHDIYVANSIAAGRPGPSLGQLADAHGIPFEEARKLVIRGFFG